MRRVLVIILLSFTGVYANYNSALSYYKQGLYQEALNTAKASKTSYSSPNLHLLWGYSAYQLGKNDEAMHAFERVLILDPNNQKAKKYLAKVYKKTGREALLDEESDVVNEAIDERGALAKPKKQQKLKVKSSFALGYNSNAGATPDSTALDNYFDTNNSEDPLTSFFVQMSAGISYEYDFGEEKGWYMKTALDAFIQSNFTARLYDLSTLSLEWGPGYRFENYNLYLPLSYTRVNYLDKDLLANYRFLPTLFIPIDDKIMLNLSFLFAKNTYIHQEDKARDDESVGISFGGYFLFDDHFAYISAKYENKNASRDNPIKYTGASYITANIGLHYNFTQSILGVLDYRFRYGKYDDKVGLTNTIRDDNLHLLNLKLSYKLTEGSELYISENYTQNLSNYSPSEYRKHNLLFGVNINY